MLGLNDYKSFQLCNLNILWHRDAARRRKVKIIQMKHAGKDAFHMLGFSRIHF